MHSTSKSDVISKELENLDLIYDVNLMIGVFKIILKFGKLSPNIVKYCHLSPSGNQALMTSSTVILAKKNFFSREMEIF